MKLRARCALPEAVSNLEQFAQWHANQWESTSKLSAWLRFNGEKVRRNLSDTAEELRLLYEAELSRGQPEVATRKMFNEIFDRLSAGFAHGLVKSLHSAGLEGAANAAPSWNTSPGLMCTPALRRKHFGAHRSIRPRGARQEPVILEMYVTASIFPTSMFSAQMASRLWPSGMPTCQFVLRWSQASWSCRT